MSGWQGRTWRRSGQAPWTMAALAIVLLLIGAAPGGAWGAQSEFGTPAAVATEPARRGVCEVPDPAERAPATDGTDAEQGVVAESGATPDPEALALQAEIDRVVRALAACLTTGQHQTVAALATGRYLGLLAGTGGVLTDETYVALAQDLPTVPVAIRAIEDVRRDGADAASADVVYVLANQLVHGRWTFVLSTEPGGGSWLVDGEQPLPVAPPPGATRVEVVLDEYEIDPERARVDRIAGGLVLAARNAGEREHELLVLRLDGGAEPADLLRAPGPRLPEGFAFVGQVTLPPGGQAELILVDLVPGRYALVSLLLDDEGVPDLRRGMEAELRIG